jgi:hypothetical protein
MVNYTVTDCNGRQELATEVITATNTVPINQIYTLLGYTIAGNFAQSPSVSTEPPVTSTETSVPLTNSKLWIIGAVLGPIAFVLLLIGLFVYLYFKCRPRSDNHSTIQVYSYN